MAEKSELKDLRHWRIFCYNIDIAINIFTQALSLNFYIQPEWLLPARKKESLKY